MTPETIIKQIWRKIKTIRRHSKFPVLKIHGRAVTEPGDTNNILAHQFESARGMNKLYIFPITITDHITHHS